MSDTEENLRLGRILAGWDDNPAATRAALIEYARERVRKLAGKMLRGSYARVAFFEETDDVLQEACLRLSRTLEDVQPTSPDHFLKLASTAIRRTLIDLARHHYGPEGDGANRGGSLDDSRAPVDFGADSSDAPHRLHRWSEFHERVESLPDDVKNAFKLDWYLGMKIAEIADHLGISKRTVDRRLLQARLALAGYLVDEEPEDGFVRRT